MLRFHRRGTVLSCLGWQRKGQPAMWGKVKQTWRRIKAAKPGQRFQQEFRRHRGAGRSPIQKILLIGVGLLFMAAGLVLFVIPGPGLVFFFIGAFLIAQQSLLAARALDWSEVRLRKLLAWSFGRRRRFSAILKLVGSPELYRVGSLQVSRVECDRQKYIAPEVIAVGVGP